MKLDGFGIFVIDIKKMVEFYKNVLKFNIKWVAEYVNIVVGFFDINYATSTRA